MTYPILLDVSARRIVIVGGGGVAVRKATGVLAAGAKDVTAIAPKIQPDMPPQVKRILEPYRAEHLRSAGLIFAATDSPQVNAAVVKDAHERGLLVCRADSDDENPGDFSTPAMIRRGAMTITVSAGGSAALAATIRDQVEATLDPAWEKRVEAMQKLRPMILSCTGLDAATRQKIFRELAGDEALAVLDAGGMETLLNWLKKRFAGFTHA
jgi:precorrin-2 dehydrogenase / sirohydrochlorin ferrochelatase